MDLTDFILARVDDDEGLVREAQAQQPAADESWRGGQVLSAALARGLADCELKRALVAAATRREPKDFCATVPATDGQSLRLIALACADHPDYRQEWAP